MEVSPMFSLELKCKPTACKWYSNGKKIHSAKGFIEALDHPMTQFIAVARGNKVGISIIEQPLNYSGDGNSLEAATDTAITQVSKQYWDNLCKQTKEWPLHWFWIEVDNDSIDIISSPKPTIPVFLTSDKNFIRAHWDPKCLYPYIKPILNWEAAAYYLCTFEQPISNVTLIDNLYQLVAGYQAKWTKGHWQFKLPTSTNRTWPRILRSDSDPVETFDMLLTEVVDRLTGTHQHVATGLSGGLDSTLVAATLASLKLSVDSMGIQVPGDEGLGQHERRMAAVKQYKLTDHTYNIGKLYSPWSRINTDDFCFIPWEEFYFDPFESLYKVAADQGTKIFFTGLGGDDLLPSYWDELPDKGLKVREELLGIPTAADFFTPQVADHRVERARMLNNLPRAFVQRSVLDSASGMASQCLRHGLWPAHPLIAPELAHYCHSLPREYRENRKLMRDSLTRRGVSRMISHPTSTESFEYTCQRAMRQCPEFDKLIHSNRMADLGFINQKRFEIAFDEWKASNLPSSKGLQFVSKSILEATLMSIERCQTGLGLFEEYQNNATSPNAFKQLDIQKLSACGKR
jgi:asparagine synthase (glutamine-hydrolysing)